MTNNDMTSRAAQGNTALVYNGAMIADRGEMLSLTDMWKAAGSPINQEPFNWARFDGAGFIDAVALAHNLSHAQVMKAKRGKGGATFAHWQIALAYAKYLSPEFHMWCNEVVRDRMERRPVPTADAQVTALSPAVMTAIGGMVKGIIAKALGELVPALVEERLAADPRTSVLDYKSVTQSLSDYGVPPKGRRSLRRRVWQRLHDHCVTTGAVPTPKRCARTGTWLYPVDVIDPFLRSACVDLIRDHYLRLEAKSGQPSLFPVPGGRRSPRGVS